MKTLIYVEELGFPKATFHTQFILRPDAVPGSGEIIRCSWKPYDLMVRLPPVHIWMKESDEMEPCILLRCMRLDRETGNIITPPPEESK